MQAFCSGVYKVRLWWLWLVCPFRFRWAHRPLCGRFRPGVIKLGSVYLCRSCACAYTGILICGLSLMLLRPSPAKAVVALAGLSIPTLALSGPWCYKKLPRAIQDLLRWAMGAVIALCGYILVCRELIVAVPVAIVLIIFWRVYLKARRNRRIHECDGCEELLYKRVCSGCELQADGIRRYEAIATRLYLTSGQVPDASALAEAAADKR